MSLHDTTLPTGGGPDGTRPIGEGLFLAENVQ